MSQIVCNLRHNGKFVVHVLIVKARGHKISRSFIEICVLQFFI